MSKFVLKNQRVDNNSQRDCTEFRHVFASGFALAPIWIGTSIVRARKQCHHVLSVDRNSQHVVMIMVNVLVIIINMNLDMNLDVFF